MTYLKCIHLSLIGIILATIPVAAFESEKVLYETDSLYHHIRVSQQSGYRYLSFNRTRGSQSAVNVNDPFELKFAYTQASFLSLAFLEEDPKSVLYVGLGGGSMPKVMNKLMPGLKIDIAEIDPEVVRVAKRFFFFTPTENMKVYEMDGRQYLRRNRATYDLIFLDAYNDNAIPFHLSTKEFYEIVKSRLNPKGVLAANVWGPRNDEFYLSSLVTFQAVFPRLYTIDAVTSNNYIFIATPEDRPMDTVKFNRRAQQLEDHFKLDFSLTKYARAFEEHTNERVNADVLLDDYAPVDILKSRKVQE